MQKKLQTQRAVKSVMEQHLSVWQSVSALASLYDRFVINLKKIEDHLVVTQQDLKSLKATIPEMKLQLLDRLHAVSGALGVYASEEGDRKLLKLANKKRSDLKKLKSAALIRQAERVYQAAKKLSDTDLREMKKRPKFHISGYGLTENHLMHLQQALESYEQALQKYDEAKTKVKKSWSKMDKKIRENNLLLSRRIDRVILLFKEINPDFFESYVQSRKPSPNAPEKRAAGRKNQPESSAADTRKQTSEKKAPVASKKPAAASVKPAGNKPASATTKTSAGKKPAGAATKTAAGKKPASATTKTATGKNPPTDTAKTAATGKQTPSRKSS